MESSSYIAASKCFLVKDFSEAYNILTSSKLGTHVKSWQLYLALCDRAFVEPDDSGWPLNDPGRRKLKASILKSTIWSEILAHWDAEEKEVPNSIIQTGFRLAIKHQSEPAPITAFVENLLAHGALQEDMFEVFVVDILGKMQHDFFFARELVKMQSAINEESKIKLLSTIDRLESEYAAETASREEQLAILEKQRVEEAIARAKEASSAESSENVITTEIHGSVVVDQHDSQQTNVSPKRLNKRDYHHRTLVQIWKAWLHDFVRSQGLYNALIVILMLLAAVTNTKLRIIVNQGGRWVWKNIKASMKMGLSVTYL